MIRRIFLVVTLLSMPAWAQSSRFEVGVKGGAGAFTDDPRARGLIGVELCEWCSGRFALFGDYTYWPQLPSAHTAGAGVRIQKLGAWCFSACFVDLGIAGFNGPFVNAAGTSNRGVGFIAGGGVKIPAGQHFYLRPQVRIYALGSNSAVSAEVGVGWRF